MAKDKEKKQEEKKTPPITLTETGFDFHGSKLSAMDAIKMIGKAVARVVQPKDLAEAERTLVAAFQEERGTILEEEEEKRNVETP